MVSDRVVQGGREHPSKKSRKTALDFQGQTASAQAVRLSLESFSRESSLLSAAGTTPTRRKGLAWPVPPGSKNRAKAHEGSLGTWETRPSPLTIPARDPEHQLPGTHGRASRPMGANCDARVVSPNDGNEVRRK